MSIRVSIVEDNEGVREGLATLINAGEGLTCVSAHATAEDALREIPGLAPDVVLMDINLPRMSGIECVKRLKVANPKQQVLMLTVYEDGENIFDSLAAGASGYLLKRMPSSQLLEAIVEVHRGGSPMSGSIARKVVESFRRLGPSPMSDENLSKREEEILGLLAKGYRYKEIADQLFISVETVRSHLHKIYDKLHVRSRTEAVVKYLGGGKDQRKD